MSYDGVMTICLPTAILKEFNQTQLSFAVLTGPIEVIICQINMEIIKTGYLPRDH